MHSPEQPQSNNPQPDQPDQTRQIPESQQIDSGQQELQESHLPSGHRKAVEHTPSLSKPEKNSSKVENTGRDATASSPSQARTYASPKPSKFLMNLLGPISRNTLLMGPPIIRSIPGINKLPGARGIAKISQIDFPQSDIDELRAVIRPDTAAFLAPNHPEFLTDWLVDKEVSTKVAPYMTSWADYSFVNMKGMQWVWLKSNLISNTPDAKIVPEYGVKENELDSLKSALRGDGTLLHPEGHVSWTSDHVHSLLPGIGRMPVNASQLILEGKGGPAESAYIVPIVWKLRFPRDVSKELHREMRGIEKRLQLPSGSRKQDPATRFFNIQREILERQEEKFGLPDHLREDRIEGPSFFDRQEQLSDFLFNKLTARYGVPEGHHYLQLVRLGKSIKASEEGGDTKKEDQRVLKELTRLAGFNRQIYGKEYITQEHMAESLKRVKRDLYKGKWHDSITQTFPTAIAERVAHIRSAGPIEVTAEVRKGEKSDEDLAKEFVVKTHEAMQRRLDALNTELEADTLPFARRNPFHAS